MSNFFLILKDRHGKPIKISLTVHVLKAVCCWPVRDDLNFGLLTLYHFIMCYIICNHILINFGHYYYIYVNFGDLVKVTECISTLLSGQQTIIRVSYIYYKRKEFRKLFINFGKYIFIRPCDNFEQSENCNKEVNFANICVAFNLFGATLYTIIPFLENRGSDSKHLPFLVEYPFNIWFHPVFEMMFALCLQWIQFVSSSLIGFNCVLIFIIIYVCGQYLILTKNIEGLADVTNYVKRRTKLEECVQHHVEIITFIKEIEDLFSPIILVYFLHCTLTLCVIAFQIVVGEFTILNISKLILYFFSTLSQLFILCFEGDKLKEYSWNLSDAAYFCGWEKTEGNMELMKDLQMIICRAQTPKVITAMKFSDLCLKRFGNILRSSLSYFTLLKTLIDNET